MVSLENQQQSSPATPPSLSAGDHEMRDYYAAQDAPQPTSNQTSYLTPYLGLRARLSQVWINCWTILILLVLIRTLLAIASINTNLNSGRRIALSACTSVENVGSAMASMPHYMSQGVNELSADGIEKAINGLMHMLLLSITGVEEIVVFIINLLTSTYVCLITFAVGGGLHVAIDVAEDVGNFLNATAKDIGSDLANVAGDLQKAMNDFLGGIDDIGSFFTGKTSTPPTVNFGDAIAKLNGLQLPSDYDQDLAKLNASIPTFAEVNNFTNNAIKLPFEEVKKLLNESMGRYSMNRSLFPVPPKEQLTFCSDNNGINDFFDGLVDLAHLARTIFIVVLVVAALLACVPMAYREIRRWNLQKSRAQELRNKAHDPMDAVYIVVRPYTSSAGIWLSEKFASSRQKTLVRWTLAYATTDAALFVLWLAIAGLLTCLCQYILLKTIEKEIPAYERQVDAFADKIVASLTNASVRWAAGTNDIINTTNANINDDVFGWVNTTTSAVNDTLNVFVDGMMDVLNETFGGTILYGPVLEVLNCLVLLKIQGIAKALTWVSDNAHIDFPLLPNDTFSLGTADKISGNGSNSSILATGPSKTASDGISSAVTMVTTTLAKAIREEAIISTCVLLIWVIIVFVGFFRSGFLILRGGDKEIYHNNLLPKHDPAATEKDHLDGFPHNSSQAVGVPTYEQATHGLTTNTANKYNGQAYTLSPRRFPTFQFTTATSPILSSGFNPSEKVGSVGSQNVESALRRPTHIRSSSYANYAVTSPVDPTYPDDRKSNLPKNPFADHAR